MQRMNLGVVALLALVAGCGGQSGLAGPDDKPDTGGTTATGKPGSEGGGTGEGGAAPIGAVGGQAIGAGGMYVTSTIIARGGSTSIGTTTGTGIWIGAGGSVIGPGFPIVSGGAAPTPINCQPATVTAASSSCQVDLKCDNDYIFTSCYSQSAGAWSCSCNSNYSFQSYTVTGGDSNSACKAMAEVCGSGKLPTFTGTAACTTLGESMGTGYCDLQEQCNKSSEIAPGITAQLQEPKYVTCSANGSQSRCDCSRGQVYQSYQLTAPIAATTCRTISALCEKEVVFSGTPTCQPSYQSVASGMCALEQECSTTAPVSDGVTALRSDYQSAQCQDLKNGNSACNCSGNQKGMRFDLASAATTLSTCVSAQSVCNAATDLTLLGAVKCETTYQSASTQSCDANLACSQAATQGELKLLAYGDLYVSCQPPTTGTAWSCSCMSGSNQASVSIEGSSSWSVCTTATQRCPELVKVAIGSSSVPFPGGPVPLF